MITATVTMERLLLLQLHTVCREYHVQCSISIPQSYTMIQTVFATNSEVTKE